MVFVSGIKCGTWCRIPLFILCSIQFTEWWNLSRGSEWSVSIHIPLDKDGKETHVHTKSDGKKSIIQFYKHFLLDYFIWKDVPTYPSMNFRPTKPSAIESVSLRDQALHLPNYHSSTKGNISLNYSHYFSLFKPLVVMSSTFELILGIMYESFRQKDRCI